MMKNRFSLIERLGKKTLIAWIGIHLLLIIPGFLSGPLGIDTSFFSILPEARENAALIEVDRILAGKVNSRIQALIGADDFMTARNLAVKFAGEAKALDGVSDASLDTGGSAYDGIRSFLYRYRYLLLGESDRKLMRDGDASQIARDALSEVYNPVSFSRLDNIDTDPFLLTDRILMSYLDAAGSINSALTPRDGVMYTENQNRFYVLVSAKLSSGGDQNTVIDGLRGIAAGIMDDSESGEVIFTGFPFHNSESSRSAQREISLISTVSLLLLTLILIMTFRSALPWLASILMILVAAASALSQTLFIFGTVHIFTLVFGTSLIGISIDYSLHFFVTRMQMSEGQSITDVVRDIFPGIGMGMATTIISYLALMLTPIPLLRQIAVFSIFGIFSSFLTVILAFPTLKIRQNRGRPVLVAGIRSVLETGSGGRNSGKSLMVITFAVLICALAAGTLRISMNNDVGSFYSMSDELAHSERRFSEIVKADSLSRYFVVLGDDEGDVLTRESELAENLEGLVRRGDIGGWLGMSRFVPDAVAQDESRSLVRKSLGPLVADQYRALGFPEAKAEEWKRDESLIGTEHLTVETLMGEPFSKSLENLWIGPVGNRWASLVFAFDYRDTGSLEELSGDDVYWIDSVADVGATLQRVSFLALFLVGAAYVLIFILIALLRGPAASFRVCIVPLLSALAASGILGWTGAPFNLFTVFGLILALGIGIDYTIFLQERRDGMGSTFLAVALSCLSTLLSFGALSLSSFAPIADFGRIVLWGVLFSFALSPLALIRDSEKSG